MHPQVQSIDRIFCYTTRRKLCSSRKSDSWSSSCCWWCKAVERNSSNWGMLRNCTLTVWNALNLNSPHQAQHKCKQMSADRCLTFDGGFAFSLAMWTRLKRYWIQTDSRLVVQDRVHHWNSTIIHCTRFTWTLWGTWLWSYINWWLLCHHHRRPTRRLPAHVLIVHIRSWNHRVNLSVSWRVRNLFIVRI